MDNKPEFEFLDLSYMREISRGDINYERQVASVFIETIPNDLIMLKRYYETKSIAELKKILHHMQSSISIMGFHEKLSTYMDIDSYEDASELEIKEKIDFITTICVKAIDEAKDYLKHLA